MATKSHDYSAQNNRRICANWKPLLLPEDVTRLFVNRLAWAVITPIIPQPIHVEKDRAWVFIKRDYVKQIRYGNKREVETPFPEKGTYMFLQQPFRVTSTRKIIDNPVHGGSTQFIVSHPYRNGHAWFRVGINLKKNPEYSLFDIGVLYPAASMPYRFSRRLYNIRSMKLLRVQDLTEEDLVSVYGPGESLVERFKVQWRKDRLANKNLSSVQNGKLRWNKNPYVYLTTFSEKKFVIRHTPY